MSAVGSSIVTDNLNLASKLAGMPFEKIWGTLIQGSFFAKASGLAASFAAVTLGYWLVQSILNKDRKPQDMVSVGDIWRYIIILLIVFSLVTPQWTGNNLYGLHKVTAQAGDDFSTWVTQQSGGNPVDAFTQIISAQQLANNGQKTCDAIPDSTARKQCQDDLKNGIGQSVDTSGAWGPSIINAVTGIVSVATGNVAGAAGSLVNVPGAVNVLGEIALMSVLSPLLLLFGTAYLFILQTMQLLQAVLVPLALLRGIAEPVFVLRWFNSFLSAGLITMSYKIIVLSVAWAMLTLNVVDSGLYAIVAGLGAPWAAYQVISGSSLGLMGAIGNTASRFVR
jgi:hypothetical protein